MFWVDRFLCRTQMSGHTYNFKIADVYELQVHFTDGYRYICVGICVLTSCPWHALWCKHPLDLHATPPKFATAYSCLVFQKAPKSWDCWAPDVFFLLGTMDNLHTFSISVWSGNIHPPEHSGLDRFAFPPGKQISPSACDGLRVLTGNRFLPQLRMVCESWGLSSRNLDCNSFLSSSNFRGIGSPAISVVKLSESSRLVSLRTRP